MKLTTPLKTFLAFALLAGGAQAASLSLGSLTPNHSGDLSILRYTDASGIVIKYTGNGVQSASNVGTNTRGWNLDPDVAINGVATFGGNHLGAGGNHLAVSANGPSGDRVNIEFTTATGVVPGTATLHLYDLDANNIGPNGEATTLLNVTDSTTVFFNGVGSNIPNGTTLDTPQFSATLDTTKVYQLQSNTNTSGFYAFNVEFTAVPEPSTGLFALVGGSLLLFRRRR